MEKRLFLLDAYALIYRAYYALIRSPRMSAAVGFNTAAIFGFCNTLDDLLRKEKPTHIAVCFDPSGNTFRHKEFEAYKAQRDKQPEDITNSIPYIKRILGAYRIPVVEVEGYEADDVIGTLATMAAAEGFDTYMMTPDKDYGQLVGPHIYMYRPPLRGEGFEVRDAAKVCERYGVAEPRQIIDLLALEGDAADNIPGCPGVGEKTAVKLIAEWGSVENLLENTASLTGKLKTRIEENADKIRTSKWLATICRNVPLPEGITPEALKRCDTDTEALLSIYQELDFKSFIARLRAKGVEVPAATASPEPETAAEGEQPSLFDLPPEDDSATATAGDVRNYVIADTPEAIGVAVKRWATLPELGIAAYAVGEDTMNTRIEGIALSGSPGEGVYIPIPPSAPLRAEVLSLLEPIFTTPALTLISHDVKRIILLLRLEGITLKAPCFDISVAHYVIDPETRHDLAQVAIKYLNLALAGVPADARPGHPSTPLGLSEAMARYCEEADYSRRLRSRLEAVVAEREMMPLLTDVELPLIRVLADMEWNGVRIDPTALLQMSARLKDHVAELEEQAYQMAGMPFNISSPSQVGMVLFERLKIDPKAKRTARGQYSTTEQVLEKYAAKEPIVNIILRIRRLRKLVSTYLDALPALINPKTGKIHTTFNQTVTATGRISSTNPNLQNIPVRTDDGREIRRAFIPDPGNIMMSADYSQIELRIIADLSNDSNMIEGFLSGDDIHRITASKIYGVPLEEVTPMQRSSAKTANFGIIYGISAFGLSERLGISRSDAKTLIDGYFATYPHIREYLDKMLEYARKYGYVITRMGRRRYLPEINSRSATVRAYSERNAINAPVQGTAADIIKVAMVKIYAEMQRRGLRSTMIMQVHDELIFNVIPSELDEMRSLVEEGMQNAYCGAVPLIAEAGTGTNWLEAH